MIYWHKNCFPIIGSLWEEPWQAVGHAVELLVIRNATILIGCHCNAWLCSLYFNRLMQERRNSIANALELRLSCTNPSIWYEGLCTQFHDTIKWKHFPCYWPFVWGIHWWPVNSPHKGQWHEALMFSLICAWTNGLVNNREASGLRCHRAQYDVTVMGSVFLVFHTAGATQLCRCCLCWTACLLLQTHYKLSA